MVCNDVNELMSGLTFDHSEHDDPVTRDEADKGCDCPGSPDSASRASTGRSNDMNDGNNRMAEDVTHLAGVNRAEHERNDTEQRRNNALECLLVFLVALIAGLTQNFATGYPHLTLLFDSTGYQWTTDGIMHALSSPTVLTNLAGYVTSGFSEAARLSLSHSLAPMADICKTGPVLVLSLALAHSVAGKSATPIHWYISAFAMCAMVASVAPVLWLWGKHVSGKRMARICAVLAITYPGFIVNSGRILSEIAALPYCTVSLFLIYLVLHRIVRPWNKQLTSENSSTWPSLILHETSDRTGPSVTGRTADAETEQADFDHFSSALEKPKWLLRGAVVGLSAAVIMLARPPLLLLPIVLSTILFLVAALFRSLQKAQQSSYKTAASGLPIQDSGRFSSVSLVRFVSGTILGAALVLLPWAMCKHVLTGKPSISVDRYGSYNLWAGCNLSNDGWDVLPSQFVCHPEQFTKSIPDVIQEIKQEAFAAPANFADLMLRKPARLAAAPWNDFQTPSLGFSWQTQRFWHQLLLFAAMFGFASLVHAAIERKNLKWALLATITGSLITYHLINVLFITMSRYFVVAMPAVILLASWLLDQLTRQRAAKVKAQVTGLVLFPFVSTTAMLLLEPAIAGKVIEHIGTDAFRLAYPLAVLVPLAVSLAIVTRNWRSRKLVWSLGGATAICCFVSADYDARNVPAVITSDMKHSSNNRASERQVNLQTESLTRILEAGTKPGDYAWYLVLDHKDGLAPAGLKVEINGLETPANWRPLWAMMPTFRESFTYLTAFAYSASKPVEHIKQWSCIPISQDRLLEHKNHITITGGLDLRADYSFGSTCNNLSLTEFSWSKGFFADHPGEMRTMNTMSSNSKRQIAAAGDHAGMQYQAEMARLPGVRAYLLATPRTSSTKEVLGLSLPDVLTGSTAATRMRTVDITDKRLQKLQAPMVNIELSGKVRSRKGKSTASICMLEMLKVNGAPAQDFAPLAPQSIAVDKNWHRFYFSDYLPSSERKLESLRFVFAGRRWWDVLSYNINGGHDLEFSDLCLTISPEEPVSDSYRAIQLNLESDTAVSTAGGDIAQ